MYGKCDAYKTHIKTNKVTILCLNEYQLFDFERGVAPVHPTPSSVLNLNSDAMASNSVWVREIIVDCNFDRAATARF